MSVSFYIKNKRKLFSYVKVITVKEAVDLYKEKRLFVYNFDFEENIFSLSMENYQNNHSYILLGVEGKSVKGFELSYNIEKKSYVIKEYDYASENDWLLVLDYIKVLAEKLGSKIITEQGNVFTSKNINAFDYKREIKSGIKSIFDFTASNKENLIIDGVKRPISFDKKIIEKIISSGDKIKEFSKFCEDIQNIAAYSAKQFFVDDKELSKKWGYYVLIENLRSIFPYKPYIESPSKNYIKKDEVAFWKIFFCIYKTNENGEENIEKVGELIYDDFIKKLSIDKYKFIDASYILVQALNREEIFKLLK